MLRYALLGFAIFIVLVMNSAGGSGVPQPTATIRAVPSDSSPSPSSNPTRTRTPTPTKTATKTPLPTRTQTPTRTFTPTKTPAVMIAVGDIAQCVPGTTLTPVSDTPSPDDPAYQTGRAVGTQAAASNAHIFTLGDNSNDFGSDADYQGCFNPMWGEVKANPKFHPAMGNHDYLVDPQGAPYFNYFATQAVPSQGAKYSLDINGWHIIVLNTNAKIGGAYSTPDPTQMSPQLQWLENDLNQHPAKCTLAIWHQPLFSSGQWGPIPYEQNFWQVLQDHGADVVLNGHNHNYERFALQNVQGTPYPPDGIGMQEFVVGTGGADLGKKYVTNPTPVSELYKDVNDFGYLLLKLWPDHYSADFINAYTGVVIDHDEQLCH